MKKLDHAKAAHWRHREVADWLRSHDMNELVSQTEENGFLRNGGYLTTFCSETTNKATLKGVFANKPNSALANAAIDLLFRLVGTE